GRRLWVSSEARASVAVFDPAARVVLHTVDLQEADPPPNVQAVGIVMTRSADRVFVALGRGDAIAEIDPATFKVVRYLKAGARDWGLALSPDEQRLYAANGLSGDVSVID